jgi:hypothetical protein
MNPERVVEILGQLRALRFFPSDEGVMDALVRLCGSMCNNEAQVRWLVDRMTSGIYAEWPGIAEMRACFCCRYRPKDGINAYSTVYLDGLPPDPTAPPRSGIAAPDLKRLPPGPEDPELEASIQQGIQQLVDRCKKPPAHPAIDRFARMLREIKTPPERQEQEQEQPINLNFTPITPEDVARALQERDERRARKAEESVEKVNVVKINARGGKP